MKKGVLWALFFVYTLPLDAQNLFGNEWIRANQKYLKISINQTGIYRINYQDIKKADAAFLQTNPIHWQLFFRGKEIAIRIVNLQNGIFGEQDYIEYYGEANDGSQDSLLYRPQKRLHPYQTLFSDVSAYFLTMNSASTGKRIPELNTSTQGLTPEKFHIEETVQSFTSDYSFNNLKGIEPTLQQSYFEPGEGWTGKLLTADSIGIVQFNLVNQAITDWPIKLEGMVNGRDNLFHSIQLQLDTNPQTALAPLNFWGFTSQTFQAIIHKDAVHNQQITLRFKPKKINGTNNFSITYVKLSYPQAFDMIGQTTKVFHLPTKSQQSALLSIQNVPPKAVAYDITDKTNCRFLNAEVRDGQTQVVINETTRNRDILLTNQLLKPLDIHPVWFPLNFSSSVDYLIVTHASLKQSAMAYADYRTSSAGGGNKVLVVETDSLYDEFNYGERNPLALRRFADYMLSATAVKNLLLIGKACSYPYFIKTAADDLVPTIGYPGSDILLTAGLKGFSANTPAIPTGRLNVTTNEQVLAYLAKVRQLESTISNGLWRKHIVHISGGKTQEEAQSLQATMKNLGDVFMNGFLGGKVTSFSKSNPYEKVEPVDISSVVNEGVSLITFFGHAGPSITDMNFGFASPPQNGFRNSLYPLMIFNGCGVGEIFSRFNTLSTDWLLASEKGAALVLAHSYYSYEEPTSRYLTKLYNDLFANSTTLGLSLGQLQQQLNERLEKEGVTLFDVAVLLQMVLQGDPALSPYPLPHPDFAVGQKGIYLQSSVTGSTLKNSDSLRLIIPMANLGKFVPNQPVSLLLKTTSKVSTNKVIPFKAFRYRDTLFYTLPKDVSLQKIEVVIDPDNQVVELSKTNNSATLLMDWTQATGSSYPANILPDLVSPVLSVFINGALKENPVLVDRKPKLAIYLVDENPLLSNDLSAVEVFLVACSTCSPEKIAPQLLTITSVSSNQLQITTQLDLKEGSTYQLIIFGKDAAGNRTRVPYTLTLNVVDANESITFEAYPNPAISYVKFELNLNVRELPTESRFTIYNLLGIPVFDDIFPLSTGKNTFLWQAKAPGHYFYQLRLVGKDGQAETHTGKLIWLY
ncbi:C25 family cysteine peptidase [Runella sp.]|uniref:putative type IX secretion system sortase PorU2 n=1 Tax=Runella sp. TaxID=1960881 RepID=UPI00262C1F49|nr:C25 family cysteine peptidase [Runella sp.]